MQHQLNIKAIFAGIAAMIALEIIFGRAFIVLINQVSETVSYQTMAAYVSHWHNISKIITYLLVGALTGWLARPNSIRNALVVCVIANLFIIAVSMQLPIFKLHIGLVTSFIITVIASAVGAFLIQKTI